MQIQKFRLQRGWSQEQLAEVSGLSVRTIQRIESGQTPSLDTLNALAAVFDVDLSHLKETDMDTPIARDFKSEEALALAHVRKLKAFYIHVAQFVLIVGVLTVVNLVTSPQYLWCLWVAGGWGLGLAIHGFRVFNWIPFLNGQWERREVEKYLGRQL